MNATLKHRIPEVDYHQIEGHSKPPKQRGTCNKPWNIPQIPKSKYENFHKQVVLGPGYVPGIYSCVFFAFHYTLFLGDKNNPCGIPG